MIDEYAVDTGVLVEYIVRNSPLRRKVSSLLNDAGRGRVKLYVPVTTLSELLYVSSRIYTMAGIRDANTAALVFIDWLKTRVELVGVDEDIALRAGELKKMYRLALPDCIVLAVAEKYGAKPLFRKVEKEMTPYERELRDRGVVFLAEQ